MFKYLKYSLSVWGLFHHQALEKNQQWLSYDQQREAYVQSVVARSVELEQQLAQAKQQQTKQEAASDGEQTKC